PRLASCVRNSQALLTVGTSSTRMPVMCDQSDPVGTSAVRKPSRAASASRRCTLPTRLTSPDSDTSPIAHSVLGSAISLAAEAIASSTARSTDGSVILMPPTLAARSEEHTSELQSLAYLVCRLLLEKKKKITYHTSALKKKTKKKNT